MESLQRSTTSFRRQGSSGLVWDDRLLSGELNKLNNEDSKQQQQQEKTEQQDQKQSIAHISTRSNAGYRAGRVSPAPMDPPSPKLSACGFCSAFGGGNKGQRSKPHSKNRRSR